MVCALEIIVSIHKSPQYLKGMCLLVFLPKYWYQGGMEVGMIVYGMFLWFQSQLNTCCKVAQNYCITTMKKVLTISSPTTGSNPYVPSQWTVPRQSSLSIPSSISTWELIWISVPSSPGDIGIAANEAHNTYIIRKGKLHWVKIDRWWIFAVDKIDVERVRCRANHVYVPIPRFVFNGETNVSAQLL